MNVLSVPAHIATLAGLGVVSVLTTEWEPPASAVGEPLAIRSDDAAPTEGEQVGDWYCTFRPTVTIDNAGEVVGIPGRWIAANFVTDQIVPLPLGAVVASAQLVACYEIVAPNPTRGPRTDALTVVSTDEAQMLVRYEYEDVLDLGMQVHHLTDQLPYADFTPGRWAWILEDAALTTDRCPTCGGHGRVAPVGCSSWPNAYDRCPTCDGAGSCPPVPHKGGEGLWRWEG